MHSQTLEKALPYYEIPEYSKTYTAGTVAARQVDALGFRFYWATDGLTEKDLIFKPSDSARSTLETVGHIYNLSNIIVNATIKKVNTKTKEENLSFSEMRKQTLINLEKTSNILRDSDAISEYTIIFEQGEEIPFWFLINGPIADAIWHTGQIASFRRISGNPINPKINHFKGTIKP